MSESDSQSTETVPGVGRIPLLGELFSSKSRRSEKTELVLLITPRVISSPQEWAEVFKGISRGLEHLQVDSEMSRKESPSSVN